MDSLNVHVHAYSLLHTVTVNVHLLHIKNDNKWHKSSKCN